MISIHAPHAGCDPVFFVRSWFSLLISIHAPHAGCDSLSFIEYLVQYHFNPRTPCGVRRKRGTPKLLQSRFQSTHPMRGATKEPRGSWRDVQDFNPRTPCGVRLYILSVFFNIVIISIHAPHAGCDRRFYYAKMPSIGISIHAPHAGCDSITLLTPQRVMYFNPRTPCGVRLGARLISP